MESLTLESVKKGSKSEGLAPFVKQPRCVILMPVYNEENNIDSLINALNYFYELTKNKISFEYILFDKFNDTQEDAELLSKLCRKVPVRLVNIIEYNTVEGARFQKPKPGKVEEFASILEKNGVNAKYRKSRGKDIDAACGQLANKQ